MLLLLDDGEVLLDDVAVDYEFIPSEPQRRLAKLPAASARQPPGASTCPLSKRFLSRTGKSRGRLKVGSQNLFFDADDWRDAVVRVRVSATRPAAVQLAVDDSTGKVETEVGNSSGNSSGNLMGKPQSPGNRESEDVANDPPPEMQIGGGWPGEFADKSANRAMSPEPSKLRVVQEPWTSRFLSGLSVLGINWTGTLVDASHATPAASVAAVPGRRLAVRMVKPELIEPPLPVPVDESHPSDAVNPQSGSLSIYGTCLSFQREGGTDHPYVDVDIEGTHVFHPLYSSVSVLHELVAWVQSVNTISSRRERSRAIREAVRMRETKVPFDISFLEHGVQERTLFDKPCAAVYALSRAPGRVRITTSNIYLMPIHGNTGGFMKRIGLSQLRSVRRMRHGVRNAALEIGYHAPSADRNVGSKSIVTLMLSFKVRAAREEAVETLHSQVAPRRLETYDRAELDIAMSRWRAGELSNFEYILYVNMASGRSFNDLSQYPVFPWVVADYQSDVLDFDSPEMFRDFSLPIGALKPERRAFFEERYAEMPPPRFHFGTHYSTPAYVINYLVRAVPGAMLRLQNGRFDAADRLFNSISEAWEGVSSNQTDVKELIPEFFAVNVSDIPAGIFPATATPSEFLDNVQALDLGVRQDGKRVDDVELPPWACGSADVFLQVHRAALESVHVSNNIHQWLDLIFGVHARQADHCNVFYTDVAAGDALEKLDDVEDGGPEDDDIAQLDTVFLEFGRTPEKVFQRPHPPRFGTLVLDDASTSSGIILAPPGGSGNPEVTAPTADGVEPQLAAFGSTGDGLANDVSPSEVNTDGRGGNLEEEEAPQRAGSLQSEEPDDEFRLRQLGLPKMLSRQVSDYTRNGLHQEDSFRATAGADSVSDFDTQSVGSRSLSAVSYSERRLSVTMSPSCAFLGQLAVDDCAAPVLEHLLAPVSGSDATLKGYSVSVSGGGREPSSRLTVATAWSDRYLRIYVDQEAHRSRLIEGISSVCCGDDGVVFVGTAAGEIGMYNVSSGRWQVTLPNAHEGAVNAMLYSHDSQFLVTASQDATIRIWNFDPSSHVLAMLRRHYEVDAEDSVIGLAIDLEGSRLYVAGLILSARILTWDIDLATPSFDLSSTQPVFDVSVAADAMSEVSPQPGPGRRRDWETCPGRISWVEGIRSKRMIAYVHREEGNPATVRLWKLSKPGMHAAEISLSSEHGVTCVCPGFSRGTLFVGGVGLLAECDRTGLCLHQVTFEGEDSLPIDDMFLLRDARTLVVRRGNELVSWREAKEGQGGQDLSRP